MSHIKKYYKLSTVLLVVLLIIVLIFNKTTIKTDGYSVDNVYNTIKVLSSDKYMGRRFGTKENMDAVKYIEEQFKSIGLKPAGEKSTYLRSYRVIAKKVKGMPAIEILNKDNKIVKSYEFGKDFTERGTGLSCPGEITSGFSFVDYPNGIKLEKFSSGNEIAIMNAIAMTEYQTQELYMQLKKSDCKALIKLVPGNYDIQRTFSSVGFKSLSKSGYEMPTLYLSKKAEEEVLKYSSLGYKIHLKATTDGAAVDISDVMGMIPGKTDEYLFITAHLDHVGASVDGRIYPGALDNASGMAAMLEIARYIKSQGRKPSKNIVFVAFNGEEGGALGSYSYVRKPLYPMYKTTVINLDMVGASKDVPVKIIYSSIYDYGKGMNINPSSKLRYQLGKLAEELNIPHSTDNAFNSDHGYFDLYGVPAVTILDNDTSKIHTVEDDLNNIGKANIDRDMKLIMNYVSSFAYSNGGLLGNKLVLLDVENLIETQYPLIICIVIAFILLLIVYKTKLLDSQKIRIRIPLLTIILIILTAGIISYLPVRYPYAPNAAAKGAGGLLTEGVLSVFKAPILWPFYLFYIIPGVLALAVAKHRQLRSNYKGNGKELYIIFYASMVLIVLLSVLGSALLFNKATYYPVTPDFARALMGKLGLHIVIGGIAYIFWMIMRFETKAKDKSYKGLISFALIFIILLSSFYMPVAINKYVINANSSIVDFSGEGVPSE